METWDIYDTDRNRTGQTAVRGGKPLGADEYHLTVQVCLFNSRGEMLIQRRAEHKIGFPGMWDFTVCGSALAGETGRVAAVREIKEELGIDLDLSDQRASFATHTDPCFCDVFLVQQDIDLVNLSLQPEEVCDAKWADRHTIHRMIDEGTFISYYHSFVDLCFDMLGHKHFYRHE